MSNNFFLDILLDKNDYGNCDSRSKDNEQNWNKNWDKIEIRCK